MEPGKQAKHLFRGAFILTAAALITKILSAFYRIPFQNIAGDIGFYIYQQVYPFYGIAMALATTGFPVALSKLYAERNGKDQKDGTRLLIASFIFLQLFGIICFAILYIGADYIASLMDDPGLALLIRVISVVFLIFPVISLIRGYFQGKGEMVPTAASQIGEQLIRVGTILLVAIIFTREGLSLYYVGGGAMFGSITGGIVSAAILLLFVWKRNDVKHFFPVMGFKGLSAKELKQIIKVIGMQGLAICISGMLLIFIQLGDALNLFSLLVSSGTGREEAKAIKGVFDRGQPLIQLGVTAAASISLSLVPLIASSRLGKNKSFINDKVRLAMQVTLIIGAGASAGLWAIAEPVNIMLFENKNGTAVLAVLSLAILFSSYISTATAVLQGLGVLFVPAAIILCGFPFKYGLNELLVPGLGTMGAAWATLLTLALIAAAISVVFKTNAHLDSRAISFFFLKKVLLAALLMIVFLKGFLFGSGFLYELASERTAAAVQALSACLMGGLVYVWVIIHGSVFREEELALFPLGSKLRLLLPRKRKP